MGLRGVRLTGDGGVRSPLGGIAMVLLDLRWSRVAAAPASASKRAGVVAWCCDFPPREEGSNPCVPGLPGRYCKHAKGARGDVEAPRTP